MTWKPSEKILLLEPNGMRNWRIEIESSDTARVALFRRAAIRALCSKWLDDPFYQKYNRLHAFHQGDDGNWQQFEFWCGPDKKELMEEALRDVEKEMARLTKEG